MIRNLIKRVGRALGESIWSIDLDLARCALRNRATELACELLDLVPTSSWEHAHADAAAQAASAERLADGLAAAADLAETRRGELVREREARGWERDELRRQLDQAQGDAQAMRQRLQEGANERRSLQDLVAELRAHRQQAEEATAPLRAEVQDLTRVRGEQRQVILQLREQLRALQAGPERAPS